MSKTHEELAAALLDEYLYSPDAAYALAATRKALQDGRFSPAYSDVIGQIANVYYRQFSPEQAAAWLHVHAGIQSGAFTRTVIRVNALASPDRDRQANTAALEALPPPFAAWVDPGQATSSSGDGRLAWRGIIRADRSTGVPYTAACRQARAVVVARAVQPGAVPLEIGTTAASRTLMHLTQGVGVARWPYGDERITLLLRADTGIRA